MSGSSEHVSTQEFLSTRCPDIWRRPNSVNHNDIEILTRLFESVKIDADQAPCGLGKITRTDFEEDTRVLEFFIRTFTNENELIKKYLKLDEWQTEGNKEEAVNRIVEAYKGDKTELELNQLGLTSLPRSLGELQSLKDLDTSKNRLTELPASIGQLQLLRYLDVSSNHLTELPANIRRLQKLQQIIASNNRLTELSASIVELQLLRYLDVSSNHLTELPANIGQLQKLETLKVSSNHLTELPASIVQLECLKFLYVSSNHLKEIPEGLAQITKLLPINFQGNKFVSIPITDNHTPPSTILCKKTPQELLNSQKQYLSLDEWKTEGDKVEASERIVEAYLSDAEELDLRGLGLTHLPEGLTKLHNLKTLHHDIEPDPIELEDLVICNSNLDGLPAWVDLLDRASVTRVFLLNNKLGQNLDKLKEFPNIKSVIIKRLKPKKA